jgi:hypothetical protein
MLNAFCKSDRPFHCYTLFLCIEVLLELYLILTQAPTVFTLNLIYDHILASQNV